ncbi:non-specific phospholipase C6-like [Phoenix dactylifera]|uniref:Non-specific phospholipase C6-like n=1 Tax=Phoenix dactylifera TaxID=42345 RepID=A0A8B9ACB9_PHODC|nr:non-specific phospholipase C6-like [Phoenix dactylifera]
MASSKIRPSSSPLPSFVLLLTLSLFHPLRCSHAAAQQPIQAIVVLVLENRSFDHMLGWMKKAFNSSLDGLTGTECNHRSTQDPNSPSICVSDDALYVDPDPDHSFQGVKEQVFGSGATPSMSGFAEQALAISEDMATTVMKGFKPENLPVFASLVQEFAVFDRWFSSLPGPTQPNRLFLYSATSHGATRHDKWKLLRGYPQKTIFDSLHDDGLDFNIYFESAPTTLFYRRLRKLKYASKFHKFGTFMNHARDGRLARLSVLEPRYFDLGRSPANDDHPSHDVANGQKLVKDVYEALRASPQWNESLLIITYDEHGGFYDHVATPNLGIPSPDGIVGPEPYSFGFDRLGVRVPTIAVSPWIQKGTVVTRPNGPTPNSEFEHSSIPATIKKLYNLTSDFLTRRDAWAGTFESILSELTLPRADCPEVLPDVPPLRTTRAKEERPLSEFQREIVQLAAVLCGDGHSISLSNMTVKKADGYAKNAVSRFFQASREALYSGADESEIVDMRASMNARTTIP